MPIPFIGTVTTKLLGGALAGLGIATLLIAGWGARVNHLRAEYKDTLDGIVQTVERLGKRKLTYGTVTAEIVTIHETGEQFRRERDNARAVVQQQSEAIRVYEAETKRLQAISAEKQKLVAKLIADRNVWIGKARTAASRVEKLTAEQELKECDQVLDAIYEADF